MATRRRTGETPDPLPERSQLFISHLDWGFEPTLSISSVRSVRASSVLALRLRQVRADRPDFLKRLDILCGQLRRLTVKQRQEDVIAVDVGIARHGWRKRRRVMPPPCLPVNQIGR